jgi:hypothetical protein
MAEVQEAFLDEVKSSSIFSWHDKQTFHCDKGTSSSPAVPIHQIHRLQLLWSLLAIAEAALKVDICKS